MKSDIRNRRNGRLRLSLRLALVAVLAFTLMPFDLQLAWADPTSAEKQAEADEVSAQLAVMEAEMELIRADYWAAVAAHEATLAGMAEAQGRVEAAQQVIYETQIKLGNRANQMYREGPLSYLEVIFGATSFEAFTSSWDLINMINEGNAELIQLNRDARALAQAAYEEFTALERIAAERRAEVSAIQSRAQQLLEEKQALLADLEAEVAALVAEEEAARRPPAREYYFPPDLPIGSYGSVVEAAASRVGCSYVFGAIGPDSFDCSGLTSWCYMLATGMWIGRTDLQQRANASAEWSYASGGAAPGDILWWDFHVGIYAGGGVYIHAANPSAGVVYSSWDIENAIVLRF